MNIGRKQLLGLLVILLLALVAGFAMGNRGAISFAAANNPGHSWGEMDCDNDFCVKPGAIGIGTDDPQATLHVVGDLKVDGDNDSLSKFKNDIKADTSFTDLELWPTIVACKKGARYFLLYLTSVEHDPSWWAGTEVVAIYTTPDTMYNEPVHATYKTDGDILKLYIGNWVNNGTDGFTCPPTLARDGRFVQE